MIVKIKGWTHTFKRQLHESLGIGNYVSNCLTDIAILTTPQTALTGTEEFVSTALHDAPMTNIKQLIAEARIIKCVE